MISCSRYNIFLGRLLVSLAVCVVHDVNVGGESPLSREVNPKDQSRPSASL